MILDDLIVASETPHNLNDFLSDNIQILFDFKNSRYTDIFHLKEPINNFIIERSDIYEQLDFSLSHNKAFIIILFEFCERFGLISTVHIDYVINTHNIDIGARLDASRLYLINIRETYDLVKRFDEICDKLHFAFLNEEDTNVKIASTFINYIVKVISDTNHLIVNQLINRIKSAKESNNLKFIDVDIISNIIILDFTNLENAHSNIQKLLDEFLGHFFDHSDKSVKDITEILNSILIEENTNYCILINQNHVAKSFESIRRLSPKHDRNVLIGRGVNPLEEEIQLYAYMYWYGPMHNGKLKSSFKFLTSEFLEKEICIIDWACGQAMASMSYLDFLQEQKSYQKIQRFTLIEPSELALKRASLHVKKFMENANIRTINKDLDSLKKNDFNIKHTETQLHLFSNILDIELFSLSNLIKLICESFTGENYFVCVSPYITDLKTSRIDSFVNYFSNLNSSFKLIYSIDERNGEWIGTNWSRVVRIFKITF